MKGEVDLGDRLLLINGPDSIIDLDLDPNIAIRHNWVLLSFHGRERGWKTSSLLLVLCSGSQFRGHNARRRVCV
jgi:ParB-like chromosome segregation protein Spo0J